MLRNGPGQALLKYFLRTNYKRRAFLQVFVVDKVLPDLLRCPTSCLVVVPTWQLVPSFWQAVTARNLPAPARLYGRYPAWRVGSVPVHCVLLYLVRSTRATPPPRACSSVCICWEHAPRYHKAHVSYLGKQFVQ